RIVVARLLGGPNSVPGFGLLAETVRRSGGHFLAVSGTGCPDPELAAISTVAPGVLHPATAYLPAGRAAKFAPPPPLLSHPFAANRLRLRAAERAAAAWTLSSRSAAWRQPRRLAGSPRPGPARGWPALLSLPLDERQPRLHRCPGARDRAPGRRCLADLHVLA